MAPQIIQTPTGRIIMVANYPSIGKSVESAIDPITKKIFLAGSVGGIHDPEYSPNGFTIQGDKIYGQCIKISDSSSYIYRSDLTGKIELLVANTTAKEFSSNANYLLAANGKISYTAQLFDFDLNIIKTYSSGVGTTGVDFLDDSNYIWNCKVISGFTYGIRKYDIEHTLLTSLPINGITSGGISETQLEIKTVSSNFLLLGVSLWPGEGGLDKVFLVDSSGNISWSYPSGISKGWDAQPYGENFYVLYYSGKIIRKLNSAGNLVWEKNPNELSTISAYSSHGTFDIFNDEIYVPYSLPRGSDCGFYLYDLDGNYIRRINLYI